MKNSGHSGRAEVRGGQSGRDKLARLRILVAEDHPVNQHVALEMLKSLGCEAKVVKDGREVLQVWEKESHDVILMDCQMPDMDGYQATRRIRSLEETQGSSPGSRRRRIPIIALTAHALSGDRERCLEAGMDDYISKPFTRETLADALQRWAADPRAGIAEASRECEEEREPGTIDAAALERLRDLEKGGAAGIFRRAIDTYLGESTKTLISLRESATRGDVPTLRAHAESLKSSSEQVGAVILARRCAELETLGQAGDVRGAFECVLELEEEFRRVNIALEESLNS